MAISARRKAKIEDDAEERNIFETVLGITCVRMAGILLGLV
jgi:hypothetical protein